MGNDSPTKKLIPLTYAVGCHFRKLWWIWWNTSKCLFLDDKWTSFSPSL